MSPLTEPTKLILKKDSVAATDTNIREVSLLLHGNGANGSTAITDSSLNPKTVTAFGNAQISTAQSKFGGASIAFDGNGDYLFSASSAEFKFPGDFTVEFWMRIAGSGDLDSGIHLVQTRDGVNNGLLFQLNRTTGVISFSSDIGISGLNTANNAVTDNTWYHVAASRSGASIRLFLDGVQQGSTASSNQSFTAGTLYVSRRYESDSYFHYFNGYIDDLRITKGVARYTSNFTPPTTPFPDF